VRARERQHDVQLRQLPGLRVQRRLWQLRCPGRQRLRNEPGHEQPALRRVRPGVRSRPGMSGRQLRVHQRPGLQQRATVLQWQLRHPEQRCGKLRRVQPRVPRRRGVLQEQLQKPRDRRGQLRQLRRHVRLEQQHLHEWSMPLHERCTVQWREALLRAWLRVRPDLLLRSSGWPEL
jgi:hypothetical protein